MSDHADRERSYTEETEGHSHESKSKPGAKPRASRAGTRSVTTLNAEQLARKRANDREAQRAIRQRTREHIERLENRIKELSENNPESDAAFEAVQRRNAELEDELRQLRKTLYGMGEGSHSPAASQQHGYLSDSRVKMESASYPPQWSAQGINPGLSGYAPTSNPVPEPQHAWQPHLSHQNPRRSHHQNPSHMQPGSWSRNDSSDSDYDSAYGLEQEPVGMPHPVRAHPEHLQNFYMNSPHHMDRQAVHHGRQDVMWQHPNGPTSNGPFEGSPHLGIRDDRNTYGTNTPYASQPSTPGWSPNIQTSNLDAYF